MRMRSGLCGAFAAFLLMGLAAGHAEAADPAKGKKVFNKCKACHDLGLKKRVGPPLKGFLGRPAASVKGYKYSKDFRAAGAAGLVWTEETFIEYIQKPKPFIGSKIGKKKAKTKMAFPGIKKEQQAIDLHAYLKEAAK